MRKSALIVATQQLHSVEPLERSLLQAGFHTLRVSGFQDAMYRLENEAFSILFLEDSADGAQQRQFAEGMKIRPFGLITPVVVLGASPGPVVRTLLTSVLDQYFSIGSDTDELAAFASEVHQLRATKAKKGKIASASIPLLLHQAARVRLTGALIAEKDEEKCAVYFEQGHVVFASSNRDENRFGEFLVQQRIITRDQLRHAVAILQNTRKRLGRILVDEGFLKPQVLTTLVQSQVKHIVFTLFDWRDGEFSVLFGEKTGNDEPVARFEVSRLILEGIRFKLTEAALEAEFGPHVSHVSLAVPLAECQKRVHLGKNEIDFLRIIGNGRALSELLVLNSFSRVEALRLLYSFRVLGLLAFERLASPAPAAELSDRSKVVQELFSLKTDAPAPDPKFSPVQVLPKPSVPSRAWSIGYMVAGAIALSITLTLTTVFDARFSKEGESSGSKDSEYFPDPPARIVMQQRKQKPLPAPDVSFSPTPLVEIAPTAIAESIPEKIEPKATMVASLPPSDRYSDLLLQAAELKAGGDLSEAAKVYASAHRLRPRDSATALILADLLFDLDRVSEAEVIYRKVVVFDPKNPSPHVALGTIFLLRGDNRGAIESYHRYLERITRTSATATRIAEVQKILKNLEGR